MNTRNKRADERWVAFLRDYNPLAPAPGVRPAVIEPEPRATALEVWSFALFVLALGVGALVLWWSYQP